ncbi:MAG: AAA family ATPase, partial [Flavobacteriales bacterium]|nr:AAA family ATPase [Flavobacteriales bacterium]
MGFTRQIFNRLNEWKERENRKPLILRGARQVGKTTVVKEFSKTYKHRILLNLEKSVDSTFFKASDDAIKILESLFLSKNIPLKDV